MSDFPWPFELERPDRCLGLETIQFAVAGTRYVSINSSKLAMESHSVAEVGSTDDPTEQLLPPSSKVNKYSSIHVFNLTDIQFMLLIKHGQ